MKFTNEGEKEERKNLVNGAKSHIKSILIGLSKFEKGSNSEGGYIAEHLEKLEKYYLDKIIKGSHHFGGVF